MTAPPPTYDLVLLPLDLTPFGDGEYCAMLHASTDPTRLSDAMKDRIQGTYGLQYHAHSMCSEVMPNGDPITTLRSCILRSGRVALMAAPVDKEYFFLLEGPRHIAGYANQLMGMVLNGLRCDAMTDAATTDLTALVPNAHDTLSCSTKLTIGESEESQPTWRPPMQRLLEDVGKAEVLKRMNLILRVIANGMSPSKLATFAPYFDRPPMQPPQPVADCIAKLRAQVSSRAPLATSPLLSPSSGKRFIEVGTVVWCGNRVYSNNLPVAIFEQAAALAAIRAIASVTSAKQSTSTAAPVAGSLDFMVYRMCDPSTTNPLPPTLKPLGDGVSINTPQLVSQRATRVLLLARRGVWSIAMAVMPSTSPFVGAPLDNFRAALIGAVDRFEFGGAPTPTRESIPRPMISETKTNGISALQAFAVVTARGILTIERAHDFCVTTRLCFQAAVKNQQRSSAVAFGACASYACIEFRTGVQLPRGAKGSKSKSSRLVLLRESFPASRAGLPRSQGMVNVFALMALPPTVPKKPYVNAKALRAIPAAILSKSW